MILDFLISLCFFILRFAYILVVINLKRINSILLTIMLMGIVICLVVNPSAKDGAKNGMLLCQNIIIPALLPILIITNIIIKTKCTLVLEKIFGRFTVSVLRLPRSATSAIILGLIGGYPSGAILTNHLYETAQITSNEAKRIMRFCFCGGVAFIITGIGTITLGSTTYGVILYTINITVSIIVAILSAPFYPKIYNESKGAINYLNLQDAVVESVNTTIKSLLNMSAYIVLFSALSNIISTPTLIAPLLEITNGLCNNANLSLNYICAFLSFGGLCIHFQLTDILSNIKMKYADFLIWRIICATLCFAISTVYLKLFPQAVDVFSNIQSSTPQLHQVNTTLSIIMIISSAVLIFDLDERKKYHLPN